MPSGCREESGNALVAGFEDGFGQFLDEQRYAVGTGDDGIDGAGQQALATETCNDGRSTPARPRRLRVKRVT